VSTPVVVKFGGELLEEASRLETVVSAVARVASEGQPLVVVHGAGKEIDAGLQRAGIEKRQVDGLRITDEATLDVVVAVLGAVNTRLIAALSASSVAAVGLTGADGRCGLADPAPAHRTVHGELVNLGRVGVPSRTSDMRVLQTLLESRFVPVIACIGVAHDGQLFNINADTFAGHIAARLAARRMVIAGTTAGVLDDNGTTVPVIDPQVLERLISSGTATAGMIAKLRACEQAISHGVSDVVIVDGRDRLALQQAVLGEAPRNATRIVATAGLRT
jgi:acetylglutamate kinase